MNHTASKQLPCVPPLPVPEPPFPPQLCFCFLLHLKTSERKACISGHRQAGLKHSKAGLWFKAF